MPITGDILLQDKNFFFFFNTYHWYSAAFLLLWLLLKMDYFIHGFKLYFAYCQRECTNKNDWIFLYCVFIHAFLILDFKLKLNKKSRILYWIFKYLSFYK